LSATARLQLPFLSAGQAQKEFTHNEALQALDTLVAGAVEEEPLQDPPSEPAVGSAYILGDAPTGDWAGKPQFIAAYSSGGWRLTPPVEGMSLYVKSTARWANYRSGAWEAGIVRASSLLIEGQQVIGGRASAIADPSGGSTIDAEARDAVDLILAAMRQHGLIAI
jgi:hypothetical protein